MRPVFSEYACCLSFDPVSAGVDFPRARHRFVLRGVVCHLKGIVVDDQALC